jgi:hypothetical protein
MRESGSQITQHAGTIFAATEVDDQRDTLRITLNNLLWFDHNRSPFYKAMR